MLAIKNLIPCVGIAIQVFGSIAPAISQPRLSLQQAIDLALDRNLQIKLARVEEKNGDEDLAQARYNRLPSLGVNAQATRNWGRTLDVPTYSYVQQRLTLANITASGQFTIFQGGQLKNQVLANKLQLDIDKGTVDKIKNDLVLNVVTTYLQILADQDVVTAAREQSDITRETVANITRLSAMGKKTIADVDQARADQTQAELNVVNTENQLETSTLTLKQLMEVDGDSVIVLEKPPIPDYSDPEFNIDKQRLYEEALQINPDIRLALLKKQASAVNIKLAKGLYQPNISLLGGMITNYSSADRQLHGVKVTGVDTIGAIVGTSIPVGAPHYVDEYVNYPLTRQLNNNLGQYIGIGMQAQLFNHFSAHVSLAKARNADETAELNVSIAKDNLFKVIDQALLDLRAAIKTYVASSANVRSLVEAYATTVRRYDLNLTNTLDLETARAKLDKAQFELIQAQYNLLFRRKVIDYYIGKPIIL